MGKASSAKKVRTPSRAGGHGKVSNQRSLTFPVTIAAVLVLGLALVLFASRNNKATADDTAPVANVDHWHTAYGIYACDAFLDPLQVQTDPEGIHSHADGVIHIHPYLSSSAGKNATLQVFADATGLKLSDTKIDVPGVGSFKNGDDCNGKPATWKVAVWQTEDATTPTDRDAGLRQDPLRQRPHADDARVRARRHRDPEAAERRPARQAHRRRPACGHTAGQLDRCASGFVAGHHRGGRHRAGHLRSGHVSEQRRGDHRFVRAVVLVGGFGTRLRPLTLTTPKQMLPLGHRPMIEWVVGHLGRHGVDEAVLSLGYLPDAFIDAFPDEMCNGVRLRYAVEPEPLDTAGAIRFAAREGGIDDTFIVVNGDVLTDLDVDALVKFHRDSGAEATIHLTPVEDPSMFGVVPTDDEGRVISFIEKPPRDEAPTNRINAGTYVLEPSVLERIAGDRKVSIEREVFPGMAAEGRLYAMSTDDYWLDTGTPLQYLRANLDLLGGRVHQVEGIAPDAEIDASAVVEHSLVGPGSRVGARAEVHDSVLMAGARVEEGARIVRSVLGRGAAVGAGATLEGVVVGDEQVIEPGAALAAT